MTLKDRVPTHANRKKITPENGESFYATVEYADEPIEEGTPVNKATLLSIGISDLTHTISGGSSGGGSGGASVKKHILTGDIPSSGLATVRFKATAPYAEGGTFSINGVTYTAKPNGEETTLPDKAFVTGDVVSAEIDISGHTINFKLGGSGVNETLPSQVSYLTVTLSGTTTAVLTWGNPTDTAFAGVLIVRKVGSQPNGVKDGIAVYDGTAETYTDTTIAANTDYYYRAFTYNSKKQYQTMLSGAVTSISTRGKAISECDTGTLISVNENGVPTPYILIAHDYLSTGATLLLRKYVDTSGAWGTADETQYSGSVIDNYFTSTVLGSYDQKLAEKILTTTLNSTKKDGSTVSIAKKVFTLSIREIYGSTLNMSEATGRLPYFDTAANQIATTKEGTAHIYWTRSSKPENNVAYVIRAQGSYSTATFTVNGPSYRPAFTLPETTQILKTQNADGTYDLILL